MYPEINTDFQSNDYQKDDHDRPGNPAPVNFRSFFTGVEVEVVVACGPWRKRKQKKENGEVQQNEWRVEYRDLQCNGNDGTNDERQNRLADYERHPVFISQRVHVHSAWVEKLDREDIPDDNQWEESNKGKQDIKHFRVKGIPDYIAESSVEQEGEQHPAKEICCAVV